MKLSELKKLIREEIQALNEKSKLRSVRVTYDNGDVISTSMAAHLSDKQIKDYFKKGKQFNIGSGGKDKMAKVKDVEILENINEAGTKKWVQLKEYRPFSHQKGDPKLMKSKYDGIDMNGRKYRRGETILFYPKSKKIVSGKEAEKEYGEFVSSAQDEEWYNSQR